MLGFVTSPAGANRGAIKTKTKPKERIVFMEAGNGLSR